MNAFANQFDKVSNTVRTENGGVNFNLDSFENPLVKSFYSIANYRTENSNKELPVEYFDAALEDPSLRAWCGKYALMVRDITEGVGERSLGRVLIAKCLDSGVLDTEDVIDFLITKRGGRFDDLIAIHDIIENGFASDNIESYVREQFARDLEAYKQGRSVSLLAKWLPSINTSSANTRRLGRTWMNIFGLNMKNYRKILSTLRAHLDVVERKITSDRFDEINYSHVPSLAMARYSNMFRWHDGDRFREYLANVASGAAKINTTGVTAPEIIHMSDNDWATAQVMWDNRKKYTFNRNVLPVCDVSGSMCTSIGKLTAMDVSVGLSLHMAAANVGVFHGKIIAFTDSSELIDVSRCNTLRDKCDMVRHHMGFSTNIEAVLHNILDLAKESHCRQDEIPTIVFLSDMEFDPEFTGQGQYNTACLGKALFEKWRAIYNREGYDFPKMVFWNIAGRSNSVPLKANDNGLILASGFNENIVKMIVSDCYDPWEALREMLNDSRYLY